jgi:hypothetical protein
MIYGKAGAAAAGGRPGGEAELRVPRSRRDRRARGVRRSPRPLSSSWSSAIIRLTCPYCSARPVDIVGDEEYLEAPGRDPPSGQAPPSDRPGTRHRPTKSQRGRLATGSGGDFPACLALGTTRPAPAGPRRVRPQRHAVPPVVMPHLLAPRRPGGLFHDHVVLDPLAAAVNDPVPDVGGHPGCRPGRDRVIVAGADPGPVSADRRLWTLSGPSQERAAGPHVAALVVGAQPSPVRAGVWRIEGDDVFHVDRRREAARVGRSAGRRERCAGGCRLRPRWPRLIP